MKNIIAAFDGLKYAESTEQYAINIAKQTNTHLVGVFLDDATYNSFKINEVIEGDGFTINKINKLEEKDKATRYAASANFAKACEHAKLEFSLHHDHKIALQDLKQETVYADLVMISANETLTHYEEKPPTRFIRDLLSDTQCPIIVVPHKFKPIEKIILLYDGEPTSVYAIKMFSYLLPQLKHLDTEVITVKHLDEDSHLPNNKLMKVFMKRHYPKAKYIIMKGWAEEEIIAYLKLQEENTLVILGAYRRGAVSRWFRESMADILMRNLKLPLFIAHNK
jgi:hypothetical protein